MDPHAYFEYLYTLALVSITFVGFAALYIGFRQMMAGKMTEFDKVLTRNHFLLSFMVVGASLLPPLLALVPPSWFSQATAWRAASVISAIPPFLFCIEYPARRFRVTRQGMPTHTKVLLAFYYSVAALLLVNAYVNLPILYAFAVTIQQFTNVWTFVYALRFVFDEVPKPRSRHSRR